MTTPIKKQKQRINPSYLNPNRIISAAEAAFKCSDAELHERTKILIREISAGLPSVREMLSVQAHMKRYSGWYERVMESAECHIGFSLLHHTLAVCGNSDNILTGGEESRLDFSDTILFDGNSQAEQFSKIYCGAIYKSIHHDLHETVTGFGDVSGMVKQSCPFIKFIEHAYDCAIEAASCMPMEQLGYNGKYVAMTVSCIADTVSLQNELSMMANVSDDTEGEMLSLLESTYAKASDAASTLGIRFRDADILLNTTNAMSVFSIHNNIEELYSDLMLSDSASPSWEKSDVAIMRNRTRFANERFVDMLCDIEDHCISCLQSKSDQFSTRMAEKVYSVMSRIVDR